MRTLFPVSSNVAGIYAFLLGLLVGLTSGTYAFAFERGIAIKESEAPAGTPQQSPCTIGPRPFQEGVFPINGSCANYRWFNLCSGYIWLWETDEGDASGVLFGGPEQPCVASGNVVRRAITYFRDVVPGYNQTVDVFLDRDDGDGCPEQALISDLDMDAALRWNCSEFDYTIPDGASYLIVRARNDSFLPYHATDNAAFSPECYEGSVSRSYAYAWWADCISVEEVTGRPENFPYWLVIDSVPNATRSRSWGAIKGLFR
jgi:hypothetical protein